MTCIMSESWKKYIPVYVLVKKWLCVMYCYETQWSYVSLKWQLIKTMLVIFVDNQIDVKYAFDIINPTKRNM